MAIVEGRPQENSVRHTRRGSVDAFSFVTVNFEADTQRHQVGEWIV